MSLVSRGETAREESIMRRFDGRGKARNLAEWWCGLHGNMKRPTIFKGTQPHTYPHPLQTSTPK